MKIDEVRGMIGLELNRLELRNALYVHKIKTTTQSQ